MSASRSESPLSDIGSDTFTDDKFARSRSGSNASDISDASDASETPSTSTPRTGMPPAKRRRTGASVYDHPTPQSSSIIPPRSPSGSISSDSSGSVPTSPSFANLGPTHPLSTAYAAAQANPNDPESGDYVQVTRCQWTNCDEPEQGNMDKLVQHINDKHIPPRQKKYYCEWEGCNRKSMPHTSAYALKAHMRSHTKEKPFMCSVPECDRSFTRSDALAKHMRTVHETEQLRPSDPIPKGHTGGISQSNSNGLSGRKLKLTFKSSKNGDGEPKIEGDLPPLPTLATVAAMNIPAAASAVLAPSEVGDPELASAVDMDSIRFQLPVAQDYYPNDVYNNLDEEERSLPPSQLFRLLRRQIRWASEEGDKLNKELEELRATTDDRFGNPITKRNVTGTSEEVGDQIRSDEWYTVDGLLDDVLNAEADRTLAAHEGKSTAPGDAPSTSTTVDGMSAWQRIKGLETLA